MRKYHNLYLKTHVLLLGDVFENFRDMCLKNFNLDISWYYTTPGYSWDCCLKMTKQKLELLSDPDMHLMIEKGIIGGISQISTRYGEGNNPYMEKFDPSKKYKYITYLNANNLYGWAMSKKLPTHNFQWMEKDEFDNWDSRS